TAMAAAANRCRSSAITTSGASARCAAITPQRSALKTPMAIRPAAARKWSAAPNCCSRSRGWKMTSRFASARSSTPAWLANPMFLAKCVPRPDCRCCGFRRSVRSKSARRNRSGASLATRSRYSSLHSVPSSDGVQRVDRKPGQFKDKETTLKRFHLLMLAAALAVCSLAAQAQAAEIKIGFIDADRINRESAPAERATKKLEKEFAPREQELRKMEQQIKSLQGQLEKDGLTMSETDRRNKEQELGRQTREFQRLQREFREDLNLRRNEELAALFERANKVIKQIAEAEKFDLILQEAVYRNPRIDITDKVLKALAADK